MAIDRGVEHVIKKLDGTIGERNTYPRSRDKNPPKGRPFIHMRWSSVPGVFLQLATAGTAKTASAVWGE
jgi:hypothetical protein